MNDCMFCGGSGHRTMEVKLAMYTSSTRLYLGSCGPCKGTGKMKPIFETKRAAAGETVQL